jgi:hypothetical protein
MYQLYAAWEQIHQEPITLLVGNGIGSRSTSRALGVSGGGLLAGDLGTFTGTSLSVLVGDFGLAGLAFGMIFLVIPARRLLTTTGNQLQDFLHFGLMFFWFTLPFWMLYMDIWTTPVTMLMFWVLFGQSLRYSKLGGSNQIRPPRKMLTNKNSLSPRAYLSSNTPSSIR